MAQIGCMRCGNILDEKAGVCNRCGALRGYKKEPDKAMRLLGKLLLGFLVIIGLVGFILSVQEERKNASRSGSSKSEFKVGDIKSIRLNPSVRASGQTELVLFESKEDLYRLMKIIKDGSKYSNETAKDLLSLYASSKTFKVTENTKVEIIDSGAYSGADIYKVNVLEGVQKNRSGWLMDLDLK